MTRERISVEAIGETVGEAKWAALRELERRAPGLDREAVEYQVLSEGERGLMGVGREPARVAAAVEVEPEAFPAVSSAAPPAPTPAGSPATGADADALRDLLTAVCAGIGMPAEVDIRRGDDDELTATLGGGDLGVLIGKHGHTLDALQYLVKTILSRAGVETTVTVDVQGYRGRREAVLRETARNAANEAIRRGRSVPLEPMSAAERKVVHLVLQDREDVETVSEGREPRRRIVVRPRASS